MIGFGITRDSKLQDLEWKYSILTQATSKIPGSLSYCGNAVLDARGSEFFGSEKEYGFIHRLSYPNQLSLSKRFGDKSSFQFAPSLVYINSVPERYRNIIPSVNIGARLQVLGFHTIILEYDQPLLI